MKSIPRSIGGPLAIVALAMTAIVYNVHGARGSDHQQSLLTFQRPAADITDVYLYPASDPTRVVLQMDTTTSLSPGANTTTGGLDPGVLYQFKIAHGKPGVEDMVIQILPQGTGNTQTLNVYGPFTPSTTGTTSAAGTLTGNVPFNVPAGTTLANGMKVFVGPRADPFFFDLPQFLKIIPDRDVKQQPNPPAPLVQAKGFRGFTAAFNTANGTNCDTTPAVEALSANNANVIAIVIEAPRSLVAPASGSQVINLWTTASTKSGT